VRLVVDTNVLVSAMLTGGGAPDEVLQLVLRGDATLLVDTRILAEYDEVTTRPRFGFDAVERRALLDVLTAIAEPVPAPPLRLTLPDPDDVKFVEVAAAGRADALVTGNQRHFKPRSGRVPVRVVSPRVLMQELRTSG
jgi:putative PIN family toxin of toxin-antitoxin system